MKKPSKLSLSRSAQKRLGHAALPKIVSLFSGAGGLDLGFALEKFSVAVAFDNAPAAVRTHNKNFKNAKAVVADLAKLGADAVVALVAQQIPIGERIGVIGGPPCQGFSRANVGSDPNDPRNRLPSLYVKIIKKLQATHDVEFVVFENVLGMKDKKHAHKYRRLVNSLKRMGFSITEQELCALDYGVPQVRRRIVLSALKMNGTKIVIRPRRRKGPASVREAIGNLPSPAFFERSLDRADIPEHPNHWTMMPRSDRFKHNSNLGTPSRSFKRLKWDKPSPTIAFGHREIHIHPTGKRRLSIYEAMLLQGFPKSFILEGNLSEQVEQVSNAVPPPLARSVASAIRSALCMKG